MVGSILLLLLTLCCVVAWGKKRKTAKFDLQLGQETTHTVYFCCWLVVSQIEFEASKQESKRIEKDENCRFHVYPNPIVAKEIEKRDVEGIWIRYHGQGDCLLTHGRIYIQHTTCKQQKNKRHRKNECDRWSSCTEEADHLSEFEFINKTFFIKIKSEMRLESKHNQP
jgi:hypothetical protein